LAEVAAAMKSIGDVRMVGLDEATGLVLDDRTCRVLGAGSVTLYQPALDGADPGIVWARDAPAVVEGCLA
jgi:cyanophycinase-like exopeptidase